MPSTYSLDDVAKHKSGDSFWIVVDKKVYDVSSYLKTHPGGAVVLKNNAGRDATKEFKEAHSPDASNVKKAMKKLLIGTLAEKKNEAVTPAKKEVKNSKTKANATKKPAQKVEEAAAEEKKREEEQKLKIQAEEDARREAEEAAKKIAEDAEAQKKAEEEAAKKAEEEAAKKALEDEAEAQKIAEEAQKRAKDEAALKAATEAAQLEAEKELAAMREAKAAQGWFGVWLGGCCKSESDKHDSIGAVMTHQELQEQLRS